MRKLLNIWRLGTKELWGLFRDPAMLILIVFAFSASVYMSGRAVPNTLQNATIAIVDEDESQLSARVASAFYPPQFTPPLLLGYHEIDGALDSGLVSFALVIPAGFQRDVLAHRPLSLQLNVDATRLNQALSGSGYVQQMVLQEIREFAARQGVSTELPVELELRARFNQSLNTMWFGSLMQLFYNLTMLSIILTGAALIKEREQGTIEHLLVMPITPTEIMLAKVWSMGLVVLVATAVSLFLVIEGWLQVPIDGSIALFITGLALSLFATTGLGIFFATIARSMPQFGLLMILFMIPLQMLSGGMTPRESMPKLVQHVMLLAPTTHFVELGQAILYRGAGIETVWKPFLALATIGGVLFGLSFVRFRRMLSSLA